MKVWKTCYIEIRSRNLQIKEKKRKCMSNDLGPWLSKTLRSREKIEGLSKICWGESDKR